MSGHSKWKQIKHKKASVDQARGRLFSKLANNISIAARAGIDPQFNPSLRSAIDQARRQNMPQSNIERAIARASEKEDFESLTIEIYGPGGVGIIVKASTDNKNRTISEIRSLAREFGAKIADQGGVTWAFEKTDGGYKPKFSAETDEKTKESVVSLVGALEAHQDVDAVYSATDEK